jgi:hypothetical protein
VRDEQLLVRHIINHELREYLVRIHDQHLPATNGFAAVHAVRS